MVANKLLVRAYLEPASPRGRASGSTSTACSTTATRKSKSCAGRIRRPLAAVPRGHPGGWPPRRSRSSRRGRATRRSSTPPAASRRRRAANVRHRPAAGPPAGAGRGPVRPLPAPAPAAAAPRSRSRPRRSEEEPEDGAIFPGLATGPGRKLWLERLAAEGIFDPMEPARLHPNPLRRSPPLLCDQPRSVPGGARARRVAEVAQELAVAPPFVAAAPAGPRLLRRTADRHPGRALPAAGAPATRRSGSSARCWAASPGTRRRSTGSSGRRRAAAPETAARRRGLSPASEAAGPRAADPRSRKMQLLSAYLERLKRGERPACSLSSSSRISNRIDGVVALSLVAEDGIAVESVSSDPDLDLEVLAAELVAQVRSISDNHRELDGRRGAAARRHHRPLHPDGRRRRRRSTICSWCWAGGRATAVPASSCAGPACSSRTTYLSSGPRVRGPGLIASEAGRGSTVLSFEQIKELIELVAQRRPAGPGARALGLPPEDRRPGRRRRRRPASPAAAAAAPLQPAPRAGAAAAPRRAGRRRGSPPAAAGRRRVPRRHSPFVGTFYRARRRPTPRRSSRSAARSARARCSASSRR